MTKEPRSSENGKNLRLSELVIRACFVIRHSAFVIRPKSTALLQLLQRLLPLLLLPLAMGACFAGVLVNQNVAPGATSWPGTPLLNTVANPSTSSVVESFNGGVGGNTNLSQTF